LASLRYAVISPVRDEAHNLGRLAGAMAAQTAPPDAWVIVDTGSSDSTLELVRELASQHSFIRLVEAPDAGGLARGGAITRGFQAGLDSLAQPVDVVVKLDADVSFEPDYFARLVSAFGADPALGLASGSAYEERDGAWRQVHTTRTSVWGASRAYRRQCLQDVLPLEERMGWDGIDVAKANALGWTTRVLLDLPFYHHRVEASRERSRWHAWAVQGEACHYMGYRPTYLVARTLHTMRRDPAALAMLWTYVESKLRRAPKSPDTTVREMVRESQRFRALPARRREARGNRAV
jgi:cellulose synthase/poly-beta-1,6-N-acetylglucosamine synthase-like glycosyltransferase